MERMGARAPLNMAGETAGLWMAMAAPWSPAQWGLMLAMMLPSAAPMILTVARIKRSRTVAGEPTA